MTPEAVAAQDDGLRIDARRNLVRILEAAHDVFAESGLSAGVAEVARRAGVGNATVFRRFPQKADLVVAVIEDLLRERIAEQRSAVRPASSADALREFLERTVAWQVRDRGVLESIPAGLFGDPRLVPLRDELSVIASDYLSAAQRDGEVRPDVTAVDLVVLCHALAQVGVDLADFDPEAWRRYLAVVVAGLRPGDEPLPGAAPGWDAVCVSRGCGPAGEGSG